MDKIKKQKYVAALHAIFSTMQTKDTSQYKLWQYAVGVAAGLNKKLVVDPEYKDKPILSLFTFSGYADDTAYGKFCSYHNYAVSYLIDFANEVNAFDVEKVNEVCYQTWAHRQAMVYPVALAVNAKEGLDAVQSTLQAATPVGKTAFENLTEKENQIVIIVIGKLTNVINDIVADLKSEAENPPTE